MAEKLRALEEEVEELLDRERSRWLVICQVLELLEETWLRNNS